MHRWLLIGVLLFTLVGCGGAPAAQVTGASVADAIKAAGVDISEVQALARTEGEPTPNTYADRVSFAIAEVAPKGGQVFVCADKEKCDAVFTYFKAMESLAGPYLYQSDGGRVVAQLNSGLTPETAAKVEAAVKALP